MINIQKTGRGQPLVLFHGWGFDHRIWHSLVLALREQYSLYCVDLPGFGKSPLMDWHTFKCHLLTVLPQRFAVLGWSMGGLFATRLALEESQCISHLMNVASSPCFVKTKAWPGIEKSTLAHFYQQLQANPQDTMQSFLALQFGKKTLPSLNLSPSIEALSAGLTVLNEWDLRGALSTLSIPVCYMFGRLDSIVPSRVMTVMQKKYPQFEYALVKKASHVPFITQEILFIERLQAFLTQ